MIGILGSGFGLYGYLPAVVKGTTDSIALLTKSKRVFYQRPELAFCEPRINWIEDESSFFESVDSVIFSVPPIYQVKYIEEWMHLENIKKVFLEKPIGINPAESKRVLDSLILHRKKINVGYVFQFTDWAKKIFTLSQQSDICKISIDWRFMAHHYKQKLNNWKRFNDEGGSVIRFYGIQIIALLSLIGYRKVLYSKTHQVSDGDYYKWIAMFTNEDLANVEVIVDSYSMTECFNIYSESTDSLKSDYIISMADPFEQNQILSLDRRVPILSELILSEGIEDFKNENFLLINKLWEEVERVNQIMEHTIS